MNRRAFLKVTGVAVAGQSIVSALTHVSGGQSDAAYTLNEATQSAVSSTTHLNIREPGEYRISGLVRLQAPNVEIAGITNKQSISWAEWGREQPVATFTAYESFDAPNAVQAIHVLGGTLESVTAVPIHFA